LQRCTAIDLEIKFLLYELTLLGSVLKSSSHQRHSISTSVTIDYDTLPFHNFLQDHRVMFIMILTLVSGSRFTQKDPRHDGGTRRDEEFEEAAAAVMCGLARHSARVNGWCEGRRVNVGGDGILNEMEV
jgi:hypothetical protein